MTCAHERELAIACDELRSWLEGVGHAISDLSPLVMPPAVRIATSRQAATVAAARGYQDEGMPSSYRRRHGIAAVGQTVSELSVCVCPPAVRDATARHATAMRASRACLSKMVATHDQNRRVTVYRRGAVTELSDIPIPPAIGRTVCGHTTGMIESSAYGDEDV